MSVGNCRVSERAVRRRLLDGWGATGLTGWIVAVPLSSRPAVSVVGGVGVAAGAGNSGLVAKAMFGVDRAALVEF
jgi:hypothetical protein